MSKSSSSTEHSSYIREVVETVVLENTCASKFDLIGRVRDDLYCEVTREQVALQVVALIEDGRLVYGTDGWTWLY